MVLVEVAAARDALRERSIHLDRLRRALTEAGCLVTGVEDDTGWLDRLWVYPGEGDLPDAGPLVLTCMQHDGGSWFTHPQGHRIAPATDLDAAVTRTTDVLAAVSERGMTMGPRSFGTSSLVNAAAADGDRDRNPTRPFGMRYLTVSNPVIGDSDDAEPRVYDPQRQIAVTHTGDPWVLAANGGRHKGPTTTWISVDGRQEDRTDSY